MMISAFDQCDGSFVWTVSKPTGQERPRHITIASSRDSTAIAAAFLMAYDFDRKACLVVAVETARGWFVVLRSEQFPRLANGRHEMIVAGRLSEHAAIDLGTSFLSLGFKCFTREERR